VSWERNQKDKKDPQWTTGLRPKTRLTRSRTPDDNDKQIRPVVSGQSSTPLVVMI